MRKLWAVRISDTPDGREVTGFVHRGKNRERVWALQLDTSDPKVTQQMVDDAEENRLRVEGTQVALPRMKGGSNDG